MSYEELLWIGGMPRSGTTWIAQVFASHPDVRLKYDPLFSFEFRESIDTNSTAADWENLFRELYLRRSDYLDQDFLRRDGLLPTFEDRAAIPRILAVKSSRHHHLIARALDIGVKMRLLAVVRDPIDTIASWIGNPTEFPPDADPALEWRSGSCRNTGPGEYWGFDAWIAVTRLHLDLARNHPESVKLVHYDDLVASPDRAFAPLFDWMGLDPHRQTSTFLAESRSRHSDHPRSVFRNPGRRPPQRHRLPPGAAEAMADALKRTDLERFLTGEASRDIAHG